MHAGANLKTLIEGLGLEWRDIEGRPRPSNPSLGAYEMAGDGSDSNVAGDSIAGDAGPPDAGLDGASNGDANTTDASDGLAGGCHCNAANGLPGASSMVVPVIVLLLLGLCGLHMRRKRRF